jgi:outer membrane protein OmpA-like peptidoglycan-associated protein
MIYSKLISLSVFLLSLLVLLPGTIEAQTQNEVGLPKDSYELLLLMNYEGIVKTDIIAITYNQKHYVPFLQILSKLQIYHEYDYTNHKIEGYLVEQDSTFRLDFRTGKGESRGNSIQLDSNEALIDQMEIYVLPEVFQKMFKIELEVIYLKLLLKIRSKFDLPIKNTYKRFMGYSFLDDDADVSKGFAPLLYDRNQSFLNGAILTYNINGSTNHLGDKSYGFSSSIGLEVLGGDFSLSNSSQFQHINRIIEIVDSSSIPPIIDSSQVTDYYQNLNFRYKWRYFVSENPYLTFISLGDLTSSGFRSSSLPSTSYKGIQFTNESTKIPTDFSSIVYEDYIDAGWEVELYQDGFLEQRVITDADGYYRFELPIEYGSSNIELRYYGPRGEYEVKKELIRIPTEFLKPGELKYSLNFGERSFDSLKYGEARFSVGLTNWLSTSASIVKFDSAKTLSHLLESSELPTFRNTNFHNATAIKLRSDLYFTYSWSYQDNHSIDIRFWPLEFGSYNIKYTVFDKHKVKENGTVSKLDMRLQLPRFWDLPFSLNFNFSRQNSGDTKSNNLSTSFNFNISRLRFNTSYTGNFLENSLSNENIFVHFSNVSTSYTISRMPSFLDFINSMSFSINNAIDLNNLNVTSTSLSINQSWFRKLNINFNASRYHLLDGAITASIGIRYDFGSAKTVTDISGSDQGDRYYSQQIEGILGFSSDLGELIFSNSTVGVNIGNGAANIRIFVDANGNDEYDEGETVVPDVRISIPSATINYRDQGGMIQAYNLRAYEQYNLTIDKNSFKNPLWIPKYEEFSFIADPNVFKQIDVPCYVGGVLQGGVDKTDTTGTKGQAGVKVHVMSLDSSYTLELPVFSDGSFYHLGIPPGDYIAYVDSVQLAVLKCNSNPEILEFNVRATETGDFVDAINFELTPYGFVPPVEDTSSTKLAAPESAVITDDLLIAKEPEEVTTLNFNTSTDATLDDEMRKRLDDIIAYLKSNPGINIEIVGHTDAFSPNDYVRIEVSEERAFTVKDYMTDNGIDDSRIDAKGVGAQKPIADNTTRSNRQKNRRVEIKILK